MDVYLYLRLSLSTWCSTGPVWIWSICFIINPIPTASFPFNLPRSHLFPSAIHLTTMMQTPLIPLLLAILLAVTATATHIPPAKLHCSTTSSPNSSFATPVPFYSLPTLLSSSRPSSVSDIELIRTVTSLYALAVDGKNFPVLDLVFVPDVVGNLSQGGLLHGRTALAAAIEKSFEGLRTQHQLGTQVVDVDASGCEARSVTYFTATALGTGKKAGQVGGSEEGWRCWWV